MKLLGPLLPFEWARVVRRQRPILGRCLYVLAILVLLGFAYLSLFPHGPESFYDYLFRSKVESDKLSLFGALFFGIFVMMQFSIGVFVMAGSTSSILAEEKEKQTLPFLLTTTMTDREIVFGKLGARIAQIMMILVAAMPVLAIMQVMGGIDPRLLSCVFLATIVSLISAAGIGAAASITAKSVKQANSRAVLSIGAYLVLGPMIGRNLIPVAGFNLADILNSGNFYWMAYRIMQAIISGARLDNILWPLFWRYLIFHGIVATVFIGWSAFRLRRVISRQADKAINKAAKTSSKLIIRSGRRPVSQTQPVLWRETCTAVGRAGQKRIAVWTKRLVFLLSFLPLVMTLYEANSFGGRRADRLAEEVHELTRGFSTFVLMLSFFAIVTTAAGCMGRERRQKTLEELYLTDLTNREILSQKALAAVWSARWHWLCVAIYWAVDLFVGGMSPWALVLVPPLYVVYVFMTVRIGMAFAVRERPNYKPAGVAVFCVAFVCAGPAFLPLAQLAILGIESNFGNTAAFAFGISPPAVLALLTLGRNDFGTDGAQAFEYLPVFLCGLATGIIECLAIAQWARVKAIQRMRETRRE
jgi:ABC-type Na+ efflux pump permease subunit